MKEITIAALAIAIGTAGTSVQAADMKGMDMKGMENPQGTMAKQDATQATHKAVGVVKKVDTNAGTVALAHQAIKTLGWPAMTMVFKVKDKALLSKFAVDRQIEVEIQQQGTDYVITGVKS